MIGVDDLIEELITKIVNTYGCTRKDAIIEIYNIIKQY